MSFMAKEGEIFIETTEEFHGTSSWKRINIDDISKRPKEDKIIQCQYCEKPATRLDNLWPYFSEMTACAEHLEEWKK